MSETTLANWVNRAKERGDVPGKPFLVVLTSIAR